MRRLTVIAAPRNARVRVTCRGRGCPFRRKSTRVRAGADRVRLGRYFGGARLRRRAVIKVRVTAPEVYGKALRLKVRRGRPPKVSWFKLDPITRKMTPW